ncbi:MAG: PAS domain-containing sensor histidine kinase [Promethearchaeia archaeon]
MISFDNNIPKYEELKIKFNKLPYSLFLLDFSGKIQYLNEKAQIFFNLNYDDVITKNIFLNSLIPEDLSIILEEQLNQVAKGDIFGKKGFSIEINQEVKLINLYMSQIKLINQSFIQIIIDEINLQESLSLGTRIKSKDIIGNYEENLNRIELEDLLKREISKLKKIEELQKNFLNIATHELKTPITSLYGASQLLLDFYNKNKFEDISVFKDLLEIINNSSERLIKLVGNLLDISKLESNNFKIEKKKQDFICLVKNCLRDVKYQIDEKNLMVNTIFPKTLILNIDAQKIERVIINLLSNAIKFTPPNGDIEIIIKTEGTYAFFNIKDSGIGLTQNQLEKVFNKFPDIEKSNDLLDIKMNGSGLGLHISKEIINLHDGEIFAKSEGLRLGSTFSFKLPIN